VPVRRSPSGNRGFVSNRSLRRVYRTNQRAATGSRRQTCRRMLRPTLLACRPIAAAVGGVVLYGRLTGSGPFPLSERHQSTKCMPFLAIRERA